MEPLKDEEADTDLDKAATPPIEGQAVHDAETGGLFEWPAVNEGQIRCGIGQENAGRDEAGDGGARVRPIGPTRPKEPSVPRERGRRSNRPWRRRGPPPKNALACASRNESAISIRKPDFPLLASQSTGGDLLTSVICSYQVCFPLTHDEYYAIISLVRQRLPVEPPFPPYPRTRCSSKRELYRIVTKNRIFVWFSLDSIRHYQVQYLCKRLIPNG